MLSDEIALKLRIAVTAACAERDARIAKKQARIDQLIQEVAAGADVEAKQRARIAELEKDCDRFERYWNEAMATHKNIAELERQLAEARKDAMHEAALICEALPAPPSCNVLERSLWDVATVAAADAIRAAIKEQT